MIISNYKLCCTNCGNITLELCKSGFVLQHPIILHCRWLPCPGKQLAITEHYTICCLWWWSWCKFLLPISLLVANSATTAYLTSQLVGSPNSRWVTLIRDVNFFNRLVYHISTLYSFARFRSMATDSTLSDYYYNPIIVSPLIDFKTTRSREFMAAAFGASEHRNRSPGGQCSAQYIVLVTTTQKVMNL